MAGDGIRIGFVSSFNRSTGMASVHYADRNGEVTDELPVLTPCGLFQDLKKGDAVLVVHLSNGSTAGIILGTYTAEGGTPAAGILVSGGKLVLRDSSGTIELKRIIEKCGQ